MRKQLFITVFAVAACVSGCGLDEVVDMGDRCPPRIFVDDDGVLVKITLTNDSFETKCCNYDGSLRKKGDCIIPNKNDKNEYIDEDGNVILNLSDFRSYFRKNKGVQEISYIQNVCSPADVCRQIDEFAVGFEHLFCPKSYPICAFSKGEYFCRMDTAQCQVDSDCADVIAGWKSGKCQDKSCVVKTCQSGYKVSDGTCVRSCNVGEHYDSDEADCVADDTENCGAAGNDCYEQIKNSVEATCKAGKCIVDKCRDGYKVAENACASACIEGEQYYDSDTSKCMENNLDNCGMKNYACSSKVEHWASGECSSGICTLSSCEAGYKAVNNQCKPDCGTEQYYDSNLNDCVDNDLDNCGTAGYRCVDQIAHWSKGDCIGGVCTVSACTSGYKVVSNACASDCKAGQHYDSSRASCVTDDTNNCGSTGHVCKEEIKNSQNVSCESGKCVVISCNNGYMLNNNTCVPKCTSTQYYDSAAGSCKTSDVNNCGQSGYKCSNNIPHWSAGACTNNACQVSACSSGYIVSGNGCVPKCTSTQYYDSTSGSCKASSITNCGQSGYKCSSNVPHWSSGTCTNNVCVVSICSSGYAVSGNECVAKCTSSQYYDSTTGSCKTSDNNNCGQSGFKCSSTNFAGWLSGSCTNNKCVATSCSSGYHISGSKCIADTKYACGSSGTNCTTKYPHANTACEYGTCKMYSCLSNYVEHNGQCELGSSFCSTNYSGYNYFCPQIKACCKKESCSPGLLAGCKFYEVE